MCIYIYTYTQRKLHVYILLHIYRDCTENMTVTMIEPWSFQFHLPVASSRSMAWHPWHCAKLAVGEAKTAMSPEVHHIPYLSG